MKRRRIRKIVAALALVAGLLSGIRAAGLPPDTGQIPETSSQMVITKVPVQPVRTPEITFQAETSESLRKMAVWETPTAQALEGAQAAYAEENYIWFQGYVYRAVEDAPNFEKTYALTDGTHRASIHHLYVMRLKVNGRWQPAYCMEPDVQVHAGISYGGGSDEKITGDWKVHLTKAQQKAVGTALLYSSLHHPAELTPLESVEWEAATQLLIWELIMGMRSSSPPYVCTDSSLIDQFTRKNGVRYQEEDGADHALKTLREKYDALSQELATHHALPSFAGESAEAAPVYTMQGNSLRLTDNNRALAQYAFASQTPIAITQTDTVLTATVPAGASWPTLTFSASRSVPNPESSACLFRVFYLDERNQALATPPGSVPMEPIWAYFKIKEAVKPGTATLQKTSASGEVAGYCFKMWQANGNKIYYGKTDGSGKLYLTDSAYNHNGSKIYAFSGLLDGEFSFREALSASNCKDSHPIAWRFVVTDQNGKVTVDKTLQENELLADGADFITPRITLTGLTGGGALTMTIENAPNTAALDLVKTSEDGKVAGIPFTVEEWVPGIGYCRIGRYTTGKDGKISIPKLTVGTTYRLTEDVPTGYIGEAPKEITIQAGTNTVAFENRPIYGNLALTKIDESAPESKLSGAEFTVTYPDGSVTVMPEVLDSHGNGTGVYRLERLPYGHYTVQETKAPEGYALNDATFEVNVIEEKTYVVEAKGFQGVPNRQQVGSIQVKKVDPERKPLSGVSFLLEYSLDEKDWKPVKFREENSLPVIGGCTSAGLKDGILTTSEDGSTLFSGLSISIGERHIYYRLTETAAPEGYTLLPEPVFESQLPQNGSRNITVTAINTPTFTLPFTGSMGFTTVTLGLLLAEFALCAALFLRRKKHFKQA